MSERTLHIGTADGRRFTLPRNLVTQTIAVVGIRGAGKTVTAAVIVEELLKLRSQVVIIDPTDVWWGLKSSADGKAEGFPVVVLGGPHGDLPLTEQSGSVLADFVVENPVSVVLSLRHLRKGAQRRFVTAFAEQLYHRKGEPQYRTPLFVAMDEASQYVPQRIPPNERGEWGAARMVGAVQDLVRLGRASGIGVALIDQRPATINKDVLTQLEVLVAHRITSPQDRKALLEWVQQHDIEGHQQAFLDALAPLPTGTAWFWSPSLDVFEQVAVRMRETFDSSKTPKPGQAAKQPEKVASIDLDALRKQLQETIEEAAANDPKELKRRIYQLEHELLNASGEVRPPIDITRQVREAVAAATAPLKERVNRLRDQMVNAATLIEAAIGDLNKAAGMLHMNGKEMKVGEFPPMDFEISPPPATVKESKPHVRDTQSDIETDLRAKQVEILGTLSGLQSLGVRSVSRTKLAQRIGLSSSSGGYSGYLSDLFKRGLIDYPARGVVSITQAGRDIVGEPPAPQTTEQRRALWRQKLSSTQWRIIEELINHYPHAISRNDLAALIGLSPTSGGFAGYLSDLNSFGLISYPAPGHVRVSDELT